MFSVPGSSFAESFYDLKRVELASKKDKKALTLSREAYMKSQLALVLFPYIQSQLDQAYQELQGNEADGMSSNQVGYSNSLKSYVYVHMKHSTLQDVSDLGP